MKNKRLFLLDDYRVADSLGKLIRYKGEKDNLEVRVCKTNFKINKIPRDFDVYIPHLSFIDERDLEDLRKEQPWSWIYGRTGAVNLPELIYNIIDRKYSLIDGYCIENILNQIKDYRKEDKKW